MVTFQPRCSKLCWTENLAPVGRIFRQCLFLIATVDRLAEPHAFVAATAGEADRPQQLGVEQVRDGEVEGLERWSRSGRPRSKYRSKEAHEVCSAGRWEIGWISGLRIAPEVAAHHDADQPSQVPSHAALVVLWSAISLQLMALPPEVFSLGGGVLCDGVQPRGPEVLLYRPGRAAPWARRRRSDLGPAEARVRRAKVPTAHTAKEETRVQGKGRLAEVGSTSATVAAAGSLAHSDLQLPKTAGLELAALPRPPPHHLLFA